MHKICFTISFYFMPLHVSSTCAHHQEVKIVYTASGIITPLGLMQFWPPDDEHMCSKHVEAWNKILLWNKFCASSWLNTETNYELLSNCKKIKLLESNHILHVSRIRVKWLKSKLISSLTFSIGHFWSIHVTLTLNPLMWKIWWASSNPSRWQMGFNLAFKVWNLHVIELNI